MLLNDKQNLETLIATIQELLFELKNEQDVMLNKMEKHHKSTMKQLQKIREFNQIADMTNQIFEKRLSNIEHILIKNEKENSINRHLW